MSDPEFFEEIREMFSIKRNESGRVSQYYWLWVFFFLPFVFAFFFWLFFLGLPVGDVNPGRYAFACAMGSVPSLFALALLERRYEVGWGISPQISAVALLAAGTIAHIIY